MGGFELGGPASAFGGFGGFAVRQLSRTSASTVDWDCRLRLATATDDWDCRLRLSTATNDCRLPTADCTILCPVPVHLVQHPLVHDALATLRDASTPPETFRHMAVRISLLLAAEATRDIPSVAARVQTPLGPADARRVRDGVVVVPVLRAGLGMLDAVLELIPTARVGHIGLQRDEMTAIASRYYSKLPPDLSGAFVLMIDPMLATGGSAVAALDLIRKRRRARRAHDLHRRRARRHRARREPSSRRAHLHAGRSTKDSTSTSSSCRAWVTSGIGCTGPRPNSMKPRPTELDAATSALSAGPNDARPAPPATSGARR